MIYWREGKRERDMVVFEHQHAAEQTQHSKVLICT